MSIRFLFKGPVAAVFDLIRRELHPDEEFDVPEEMALAFDNHGHCHCLEPDKVAPLREAEAAAEKAMADARAATGLVNAHPGAAQAVLQEVDVAVPAAAAAPPTTAETPTQVPTETEVPTQTPAEDATQVPAQTAVSAASSSRRAAKTIPAE